MPHIVVKLYSGRPDHQKAALAEAITKAVTGALRCRPDSVSVGIEDIEPTDWADQVYRPDILGKPATIYKNPDYDQIERRRHSQP